MSIPSNVVTDEDLARCTSGSNWAMVPGDSDDDYFEDPLVSNRPLVSGAISLDTAGEDIAVEFMNGVTAVIPGGTLQAGVRHPLNIVRLLSTGTGAVNVTLWFGESTRNLRPLTY